MILLTGGDPAGVSPEIILQMLDELCTEAASALLYFATAGDAHIQATLTRADELGISARLLSDDEHSTFADLSTSEAGDPATLNLDTTRLAIVDVRQLPVAVNGPLADGAALDAAALRSFVAVPGKPDAIGGRLAFAALAAACDFTLATRRATEQSSNASLNANANAQSTVSGILTAPLSKEWVARGGRPEFRGHTEYLAERFASDVLMLMHGPRFSVIPLTVHIAISQVPVALRERLADPALSRLLRELADRPVFQGTRFALCGLNPHCGDGGLFGREDQEFIADWVAARQAEGLPLDGPLPADTLFTDEVRSRYRLILSCYHDQGLIPFKALEGLAGVNVTVGLPVPRVSPDHGTAFDLAGQGQASAESLRAAYRLLAAGAL